MTIHEAKEYFGVKENDTIHMDGLLALEEGCRLRMNVWTTPKYQKDEIKRELEAIEALKEEAV